MERVRIGDYQLEAELTASLSSITYRATHQVLPRQVIVKLAREPHDSLGVLREACILAALPHPGIVRVWETGRLSDQRTWFASEIVDGDSLGNTLALGGALDAPIAIGIVRDLAEILAHAHSRGVVHAGLTPDRIAITPRLRGFPLCITDWSTARTHDATSVHGWEPSSYTAPEMARGELDDRADVFALGAIAYRAFTGTAPDGSPLVELAPTLPRQISLVVDQMLAYDRWDRPTTAEVRAALAMPDVPELRIRKPRWTPPLQFAPNLEGEELLAASQTIDDIEPPKPD